MVCGVYATDRETLERECEMEFVRTSGPGGQHKNKTETGVRLTHPPSGITVMATRRRSQARNRDLAFEQLAARLEELNFVPKDRVPTAPTRGSERRRLEAKRRRSQKRSDRQIPDE